MINILDICNIDIDPMIPAFTSASIETIKYLVPVILIVRGILDLFRAIISTDSNQMKGSLVMLFRRIVYSVLIYFVVALVQFGVNTLGKSGAANSNQLNACIICFVNNENCSVSIDTTDKFNDMYDRDQINNDLNNQNNVIGETNDSQKETNEIENNTEIDEVENDAKDDEENKEKNNN